MKETRFWRLAEKLIFELDDYSKLKIEILEAQSRIGERQPDSFELRALGAILHDVYHGAEGIFGHIAKEVDGYVPTGDASHRDLLEQVAEAVPDSKPPVIRPRTKQLLDNYRSFRHKFRHVYGFKLDWGRIEPLWTEANLTIDTFVEDIRRFIALLQMGNEQD